MNDTISQMLQMIPVRSVRGMLERNSTTLLVILIGVILVDSFFVSISSDTVTFTVLLLYGALAWFGHRTSRDTFLLCFGLLGTMLLSFVFSFASISTEKLTVWLFLFLIIGVVQAWKE